MIDRISFSILMLISMVASSLSTYGQEIDRSILSSAYHNSDLKGEWVLGETMVRNFQSISQELNSGFLTGKIKVLSTYVENQSDHSLQVFPNPFYDQVNIRHDFPDAVTIKIRDMQGRTLLQLDSFTGQKTFSTSHIPTGMYSLNYHTNSIERGIYLILKIE